MARAELTKPENTRIVELLRENRAEFTWIPADIPGLDPSVAVHKLTINPNAKRVVQKKRMFVLEKQRAIAEEVEKLRSLGFIKKV